MLLCKKSRQMKDKLSHILFHIYLWGMLLIPALHQAGYVFPHHHAEHSRDTSIHKELCSGKHSHLPCNHVDDVCEICLLSFALNVQPEQPPSIIVPVSFITAITDFENNRTSTVRWLICEYRGPPAIIL